MRTHLSAHFLTAVALSAAAVSASAAPAEHGQKAEDTIRVLIVTGEDYKGHRWKETAPAVRDVLEADERFEARIVEDAGFLASEIIFGYDVLVLHFKNYSPLPQQEKAEENLVRFAEQGGGIVLLHFACGAFEDWPEFRKLVGMVWDKKRSHDPFGPFTVKIVDHQHPVTKGLDDFQTHDELYICLEGDRPVDLLATARSVVTGKDHPMAFAFEFGQGRVFHTPLGHDVRAFTLPGPATLIRRGTAWAAGREPQQ